jgi:hypothetical protein
MKMIDGAGAYDQETINLLKQVLDDAWSALRPQQQKTTSRTDLAARILALAAVGERDPVKLRTGALLKILTTSDAA